MTDTGAMIDDLKADLKRDEGFRAAAYQDSEGYWTIGIGRLIDARKAGGISQGEADYLLENDIARTLRDLDRAMPWWRSLSDGRQRALANMCFQMGIGGLMAFRHMLAALQAGDVERAYAECLDSDYARQTPARAHRVASLLLNGA